MSDNVRELRPKTEPHIVEGIEELKEYLDSDESDGLENLLYVGLDKNGGVITFVANNEKHSLLHLFDAIDELKLYHSLDRLGFTRRGK